MAARRPPEELLAGGLSLLGLEEDFRYPLMRYLDKLIAWSRVENIIGDRDPERLVWRHLLESLCAHKYVNGQCLDLGTGAGLPGLPLALVRPDTHWVLLDSRLKCCRFLRHVLSDLALKNVTVCHIRAEQYQPEVLFDRIICRALAPLPAFYRLAEPLLASAGSLLSFKGPPGSELTGEIDALRLLGVQSHYHDIQVPGGRCCSLIECVPSSMCDNNSP